MAGFKATLARMGAFEWTLVIGMIFLVFLAVVYAVTLH